jgi:hypothetical protein
LSVNLIIQIKNECFSAKLFAEKTQTDSLLKQTELKELETSKTREIGSVQIEKYSGA